MDYLKTNYADIKKVLIAEKTPAYVITPKNIDGKLKTIIFYHGWSSSAKNQIFRANILASYGYQVVLPEATFHGERGSLEYDDIEVVKRYILETIMHNIEESPAVFKYIEEELNADPENIAVSGHSMGAITAGGLFTFNKKVKAALIFNGSLNWSWIVESLKEGEEDSYERMRINDFMIQMDPMTHLNAIENRPLAMLNGMEDDTVDPKAQEEFYKEAVKVYSEKEKIVFTEYEHTTHQLTTHMLEDGIRFLKEIAKM